MAGKVTLCMKIVGNNDEYNGYKQYFLHNRVSDLKVKLMDVLSLFVGAKLQRFLRMKNRNTPLFSKSTGQTVHFRTKRGWRTPACRKETGPAHVRNDMDGPEGSDGGRCDYLKVTSLPFTI